MLLPLSSGKTAGAVQISLLHCKCGFHLGIRVVFSVLVFSFLQCIADILQCRCSVFIAQQITLDLFMEEVLVQIRIVKCAVGSRNSQRRIVSFPE
jgi:hypothetical protein